MNDSTCRHFECYWYWGSGRDEQEKIKPEYCEKAGQGCYNREVLDSVRPARLEGGSR